MSVTTEQKNLHLLPHNREAYEKVMAHFENHQRAAIVHATGTGKSYCIAAIASHFSKVLVMAPNNFVLNETQKVCNEGVEFRTYASSIYDEVPSTGYDLIVLDEFHRAGAPGWGHGVKKIIAANPIAKILGTSATHIRYLDHERDMAEEPPRAIDIFQHLRLNLKNNSINCGCTILPDLYCIPCKTTVCKRCNYSFHKTHLVVSKRNAELNEEDINEIFKNMEEEFKS